MNRALQPELHPDTESLNAFIERALPAAERAGILDHLAGCGRCRQIVFLAQQAAAEEAAPQSLPLAPQRPAPWLRGWTLNWRLAWATAAAFALIAALAVSVHLWRSPGGGEVARVTPPVPVTAPSPRPVSEPAAPPPPSAAPVAKKAPPPPSEPAAQLLTAAPASGALASQPAAPPPGSEPAEASVKSSTFAQPAPAREAAPPPEPAAAAWQAERTQAELAHASKAARAERERPGASADGARLEASVSQLKASPEFAEKAAPSARYATKSLAPEAFEPAPAGAPSSSFDLAAARPAALLPSGLAVLSSATLLQRTVAIDLHGSLYVRDAPTGRWQPVAHQWTGRLVQVRVQPPPLTKSVPSATPAAATFAIVNASNQVWTSRNGKTWKAQ